MPSSSQRYLFENFAGLSEWFEFGSGTDAFGGKWPPHHDKVLYSIPEGRWVLGFVAGLGVTNGVSRTLVPFLDIEVKPEFAIQWFYDNDRELPSSLAIPETAHFGNAYQDPRVLRFYSECERMYQEARSPEQEAAEMPSVESEPVSKSIHVDVERCVIYLEGKAYPLGTEATAIYVKALLDAKGHWVSFSTLTKSNEVLSGVNPTRLTTRLRRIPGLADLIQTKPGAGTRLVTGVS